MSQKKKKKLGTVACRRFPPGSRKAISPSLLHYRLGDKNPRNCNQEKTAAAFVQL